VIRSASSTTITWKRPTVGDIAAFMASSRTSATEIDNCSVRTSVTSGWAPDSALRQTVHRPQPP